MLLFPCQVLEDDYVRLRPLVASDFEPLYDLANDPALWAQHPEPTRWQRPVFTRFFEGALAAPCAYTFERIADGQVVGSSRYHHLAQHPSAVEIGWTFLARSEWGTGLNARIKHLMVQHAFAHYRYVAFYGGADNHRSRYAIEKLGARELTGPDSTGLWDDGADKFSYVLDPSTYVGWTG